MPSVQESHLISWEGMLATLDQPCPSNQSRLILQDQSKVDPTFGYQEATGEDCHPKLNTNKRGEGSISGGSGRL